MTPLLFDLRLLLFDGVDENDSHAVVFDAFDFAFIVVRDEQWFDLGDLFGDKAHIAHSALLPVE